MKKKKTATLTVPDTGAYRFVNILFFNGTFSAFNLLSAGFAFAFGVFAHYIAWLVQW